MQLKVGDDEIRRRYIFFSAVECFTHVGRSGFKGR